MAAPVVTTYSGDVPLRDGSQTNTQFSDNVNDLLTYITPMVTDLNSALVWVNDTAEDVDDNRVLAQSAASTASTAASTATTQAGIATAAAASATLAPGTSATSTTSMTPGLGSKSFTLVETGKTFVVGGYVTVADPASVFPNEKWFNGKVTAFDSGAGTMTVDSAAFKGTTSSSSWVVTVTGPAFGQRFTNPTQSHVDLGTVSGAVNLDLRVALSFRCTLSGNVTFTAIMPDGYSSTDKIAWDIDLTMDSVARTIAYAGGMAYHEGANPVTAPSTRDQLVITRTGLATPVLGRARRAIS